MLPPAFRKTLFTAVHAAGDLIRQGFDKPIKAHHKSDNPINLVTAVDHAADAAIRKIILKQFPDHDLLTEESAPTQKGSPYKWIVDPLDGTTNFAHHFPQVGVSIGLAKEGQMLLGAVYDPCRDELFWAERGAGAFLETRKKKQRLQVSATPSLTESLLLTGFPYDRRERADLYLSYVRAFMVHIQGIRRAGAAALDLCWVACGRVDGYWEWRLKPWDVAAGWVIVEEAGGKISDFSGRRFRLDGDQTLATNGRIHESMLEIIRELRQ